MLEQLIKVVRHVGDEVVMPFYLHVSRQQKADGSILTAADLAAQEALQLELKAVLDCPLMGEEMSEQEQQDCWTAGTDGLWCVDPIDGTSNFVNGLQHFAISVALLREGNPAMGVVYAPATGEMFYAEVGHGAYLNGLRLPLITGAKELRMAIAEVDFKRLPKSIAIELVSNAPFHSQRNFGSSALDWCYLAAGRFDLYLHGGQYLWDYAAGSLILHEAGGFASTLEGTVLWEGDLWRKSALAARDADLYAAWRNWVDACRQHD
jgi:myo-inositol-1(or 4)-monophosphatase